MKKLLEMHSMFGLIPKKMNKNQKIKFSKYNYVFKSKNTYYVFNFRTGSFVCFEDKEKINQLKHNYFSNISLDDLNSLIRIGILTKSNNEFEEIIKENIDYLEQSNSYNFTIFTTTACNAKCSYCFEKGIKNEHMSVETANKIISFITNNNIKRCSFNWFGGEPLLNKQIIEYLTRKLNKIGVEFSSFITTNGYLVDESFDVIRLANTKKVQITLDGTFDKYEQIKKFNCSNSFIRVINNIHSLLGENISVSIRLNFDSNTITDVLNTIDFLNHEFSTTEKKYLSVYGHHIFGNCSDLSIRKLYSTLSNELFKKGFIKSIKDLGINRKFAFCGIEKRGSFCIMPNGTVYKCEHYASEVKNDIGLIDTFKFTKPVLDLSDLNNRCRDCILFPVCGGGCKYYVENSNAYDYCSPLKFYYKNLLKKLIILSRRIKQ